MNWLPTYTSARSSGQPNKFWWLGIIFLGTAAFFWPSSGGEWPHFWVIWLCSFGGALAVFLHPPTRVSRTLLWGFLLWRVCWLQTSPWLSEDVNRYVHEGRATRIEWTLPYTTPPAEITPPPDDGITARVNHPEVVSVYSPLLQVFFWASVAMGDAVENPALFLRLGLIGADLFLLFFLYRRSQSPESAKIVNLYGAQPLVGWAIYAGCHTDILGAAALCVAWMASRHGRFRQGLWLAIAAAIKPFVFGLVLLLDGERRRIWTVLLAALLGFAAIHLPHHLAGAPLGRGMHEFATRWAAAPTIYAGWEQFHRTWNHRSSSEKETKHWEIRYSFQPFNWDLLQPQENGSPPTNISRTSRTIALDHHFWARIFSLLTWLLALGWIRRHVKNRDHRMAWGIVSFFLCSPVVHPWYWIWLIPFAAASGHIGLSLFAAAAPLLYQSALNLKTSGEWVEAIWPRITMITILILGAWWHHLGRPHTSPNKRT